MDREPIVGAALHAEGTLPERGESVRLPGPVTGRGRDHPVQVLGDLGHEGTNAPAPRCSPGRRPCGSTLPERGESARSPGHLLVASALIPSRFMAALRTEDSNAQGAGMLPRRTGRRAVRSHSRADPARLSSWPHSERRQTHRPGRGVRIIVQGTAGLTVPVPCHDVPSQTPRPGTEPGRTGCAVFLSKAARGIQRPAVHRQAHG